MLLLRVTYNIQYEWKGVRWVQRWNNFKHKFPNTVVTVKKAMLSVMVL